MVKKKPAKKKKALAAQELDREEVRDELLALEAIYGEDFEARGDGSGFSLRVVPHPGEAEANHVSVKLVVRCGAAAAFCRLPPPVRHSAG